MTPRKLQAVRDAATDQNFRGLTEDANGLEGRVEKIEKEGVPASGKAGGVLSGEYPNPAFAADMATQVELDSEKSSRETADGELLKTAGEGLTKSGQTVKIDTAVVPRLTKQNTFTETQNFKGTSLNIWGDETELAILNTASEARIVLLMEAGHARLAGFLGDIKLEPTANINATSHRITNVTDPTETQDAATKKYVDGVAQGLDIKASVRVATTANVTISTALNEGDSIDGVSLVNGDRVLVKDQTTKKENGIWVVGAVPARATDADAAGELSGGTFTFVEAGTANADSGWVITTNGSITPGTTEHEWAQFSGAGQITAGEALTKTGNTLDVAVGEGIKVSSDKVVIDTALVPRLTKQNTFTETQTFKGTSLNIQGDESQLAVLNTLGEARIVMLVEAGHTRLAGFLGDLKLEAASNINATTHRITNVKEPTEAQDAATKTYVDGKVAGSAGGDLTGTYPNPTIAEGKVTSAKIEDGAIKNVDVNASAAIVYSKLSLAASVKGTDLVEKTVEDKRLEKPVIVGSVTSLGAVETGSGFSAEKTGTGAYTVTLTTELATTGIAVATPQNANRMIRNSEKGKKVFKFAAVDKGEVAGDTSFSFMIKAS